MSCVLLGISEESKAYRLYDPNLKKIIVSRDMWLKKIRLGIGIKSLKMQLCCDLEWRIKKTVQLSLMKMKR